LQQKAKRLELEQKQEVARAKALERELEWAKSSPRARQAKQKARLQRFEELANQKTEQRDNPTEIVVATPPRLGQEVVLAENLTKSFGDKLLFKDLNFRLPPGGIVGVIGPNGAGKTTLFKMITGEVQPDSGALTLGKTVKVSYVDQNRDALNGNNNAYQEISGGEEIIDLGGGRTVNARAYCGWFNFKGSDQQKLVKELSGGERNRLHLAKLLKTGGNLLLLDEPTNDLDVDTLRALEDALLEFPGCAVVISHDRWFLDRIATHILAFEGDSQVVWFEGNYQDYEADRKRRLGAVADKPTRIRYRSLER
jgi:ATPase subunit of ABC transporter with duplicated ATPase domains